MFCLNLHLSTFRGKALMAKAGSCLHFCTAPIPTCHGIQEQHQNACTHNNTILCTVPLEYLSLFYRDLNKTRAQFLWMTDWVAGSLALVFWRSWAQSWGTWILIPRVSPTYLLQQLETQGLCCHSTAWKLISWAPRLSISGVQAKICKFLFSDF